jgi:hypothetical protein
VPYIVNAPQHLHAVSSASDPSLTATRGARQYTAVHTCCLQAMCFCCSPELRCYE